MIATMEVTHTKGGKSYTASHIVTAISVVPRKPLGVRVEVETMCNWRGPIKAGELRIHYGTKLPYASCTACNGQLKDVTAWA